MNWKLIVVTAVLLVSTCALAETAVNFKGLTVEELKTRLGTPDRVEKGISGEELWRYGRSVVIFRNGKVSGYTDLGDLPQERPRARLALEKKPRPPVESLNWVNDWTPGKTISSQDELGALIE